MIAVTYAQPLILPVVACSCISCAYVVNPPGPRTACLQSARYERLIFKAQQAGLEDGSAGHILQTGRRTIFALPEHIRAAAGVSPRNRGLTDTKHCS
jgi:hypothetical protein